jgi:hypothetical protein
MSVVNAIAQNMKTGYDDWDEEFFVAAQNFLTKVSDIDMGKLAQFQLYTKIDSEFHDPRTQSLLYAMETSAYGAKVVQYLLTVADCGKMSPCGDSIIVWEDGMPANTGAFNNGTVITMNASEFNGAYDPNNLSALANLAGELAHESVETYYVRAYDIPANTLPMDYMADYIRQIVTNQVNGTDAGSYPTYQDWVNDPQNAYVKDFHESGNTQGGGFDQWWWNLWNNTNPNFAGNPMGLSPTLLQNNTTLPGWDITKQWNPNTNLFVPPIVPPQPTPPHRWVK